MTLFKKSLFLLVGLWVSCETKKKSPGPQASLTTMPTRCAQECVTPHGVLLGEANSIPAFSNCSSQCIFREPFFAKSQNAKDVFTGIKWQCVEYARRYLIEKQGVTFGSIDTAHDIFDLPHFHKVCSETPIPVQKFPQCANAPLNTGDVLIYGKNPQNPSMNYGHVAIVIEASYTQNKGFISIAEQNYDNKAWQNKNHWARTLPVVNKDGKFCVEVPENENIRGWIRINK